ncbi:MAG: phytanoyl-CoA dioxygenase family protein [Opitutales bacterium]|jgi:ectoine hydroxylase-related dioxygenase (phytanoyl-CoA dioxygenase family)
MSTVVEIPTFAENPEAALAFYFEHGYHIEPNVWSPAEVDALRRASEQLPSWQDGTYAPAMNAHRINPTFLSALKDPRIVKIMERLLKGRISAIQTEFFFCRPGTTGFAMHQDNFYVEAKQDAFASAWSPLVDVSPFGGGLVIYPGTHLEPILPVEDIEAVVEVGQDKNAHRQQVVLPKKYQPVDVVCSAGSVVFIHGHIVHSSHKNQSNVFRRVLLSTYLRAGEKFRPGNTAKRTELDVYS